MSSPQGVPSEIAELARAATRYETTCGDGFMVWRTWGSGRPVLLLHGSHGSWLHWIRNIPALASEYQLWVPDLPGYGESAAPSLLRSPESHAQAIADGLRELPTGREQIAVVAFSLGAMVGSHLSVLDPERVQRLLLVDAGGLGTPMRHPTLAALRGLDGEARQKAIRANLTGMMLHEEASVDDVAEWIQGHTIRPTSRLHFEIIPDKLLPVLGRVPVQMDALWGEYDFPHPDPEANAAVLRQFQSGVALRTISGAGHWSMFEGAPQFNSALVELLASPLRADAGTAMASS